VSKNSGIDCKVRLHVYHKELEDMSRLVLALLLLQATGDQAKDEYQYVYDTSEVVKTEKSGQRLVGASRGEHIKIPFIVVWHSSATDGDTPAAQCTGSLITRTWMVSAAHCDAFLDKKKKKKCIKSTSEVWNKMARNTATNASCYLEDI